MVNSGRALVLATLVSLCWLLPSAARAEPAADDDRTASPYFVVDGARPGVEALPLERTRADVHIAGVISDVTVTQTYRNAGDRTISARYVFPASTRAAVYAMTMTIGDRVITAKVQERGAARQAFDQAKQAGKTATLLEEDRPNVFAMSVANIVPNDRIQVELKYTELLVPTEGVYELVYPTVVGPRYASPAAGHRAAAIPYQHAGQPPATDFAIHVAVAGGMPIRSITSPSHPITTAFAANRETAQVELDPGAPAPGNRDFVLRYRLAGAELSSGLLTFQGAGPSPENFFLAMIQPPARPALDMIPAREYVFILDVSGSMHGFPLETAKTLMRDLLVRLRPTDRFDVLLFSGTDALYRPAPVDATPAEIAQAIAFVDERGGGAGGTELLPALQHAMALAHPTAGTSRSFVVVTDGFIAEEPAVFTQIRDHLGEANVWSFGIGSSVNRHLMDGIAKAGRGEAFTILGPAQAAAAAAKFRAYVETPVLTNVAIAFDGFAAYDVEPKVLPDVFASRPVVVFGKYRGATTGKLTLTGVSGHGRFVSTIDAGGAPPDAGNAALRYLWARNEISELSDFFNEGANRAAVTKLGLDYHLLTPFTSFLAIEDVVRTAKPSIEVAQPVAMPAGVTDAAIASPGGMQVGAEPPLAWLAVIVAGLAAAGSLVRRRGAAS